MRSRSVSMPPLPQRTASFDPDSVNHWVNLLSSDAYQTVNPIYAWLTQFLKDNKDYYTNKESVKKFCDEFCQQLDEANKRLNKQTYYVISSILKSKDLNMARVMIDQWIDAARKLHKQGNYFSAYAVMVALQTSYIERLYDSSKLPKKLTKLYAADKVISSNMIKKMKKHHKGSIVPMTTVLSSWMVMDKQLPDDAGFYKQTQGTLEIIMKLYQYTEVKLTSESSNELSLISTDDKVYYLSSSALLPRASSTAQLLSVMLPKEDQGKQRLARMDAKQDIPAFLEEGNKERNKRYARDYTGVSQWIEEMKSSTSTLTKN